MKRFLSVVLLSWAASAISATSPGYTNYGFAFTPMVDATNFVNYGTFSTLTTAPYSTYNTRSYLNLGIMSGDAGFRFDTAPYSAGSQRSFAASFVNGTLVGTNNASIYGETHLLIFSTNIVNRGLLSIGEYGLIRLEGLNVDLLRGAFQVGTFTDRTNVLPEGVFDDNWSLGTARITPDNNVVTTFPITPVYSLTQFIPGGGNNPYANIARTQLGLTDLTGTELTSAEFTREEGTNRTVQIVFLRNPNTNITTEIRSAPNENAQIAAYALGTPTIVWRAVGTNAFGQIFTNELYLRDTFGVDATNGFILNYPYSSQPPQSVPVPPATQQPDNFRLTRTAPNEFVGGELGTPFEDKPHDFWTTNPNPRAVTGDYSAYGIRIATTTTDPLQVTNLRSGPGRIEVKATQKLDLTLARIDGLNYLSLTSTNHFKGAAGANISSTYCDVNLGSTNGSLNTSGLLNSTLPRFSGEIDCFSIKWTDTVIFNGSTNPVNFHVLYVDSDLSEFTSPQVFDLQLRSTNLMIGDTYNVLASLSLDTDRLTILSNGTINVNRVGINWAESANHLKTFTNLGSLYVPDALHFISRNPDGTSQPYESFVNRGTIMSYGTTISSDNVENSGFIDSFYGPIFIQASSSVLLSPSGYLWAPNSEISIAANDLYITNQTIQLGRSLSLSVTNSLNAGANFWQVYDGFNLWKKPVTGDLLETEIYDTAFPYDEIIHTWASEDRGPTADGFTDNAALGALDLDGGENSLFTFSPAGPDGNALYVDVLYLLNSATNRDVDGNLVALNIEPGMKLYFSQAFIDDGFGGLTDITSELAGKNGGSLVQVSHTGPLSVPAPIVSFNAALKVKVETAPTARSLVTWETPARATNTLFYVNQPGETNWQVLTNFVSGTSGGTASFADPFQKNGRFYKVRVDKPAY